MQHDSALAARFFSAVTFDWVKHSESKAQKYPKNEAFLTVETKLTGGSQVTRCLLTA